MDENECYNANLMPLSNDKDLKKAYFRKRSSN